MNRNKKKEFLFSYWGLKVNHTDVNTFHSETYFIRGQDKHVLAQCEHKIRVADGMKCTMRQTQQYLDRFVFYLHPFVSPFPTQDRDQSFVPWAMETAAQALLAQNGS